MNLSDFDFQLPPELIAQKPSPQRGESRLLVVDRNSGTLDHASFSNLSDYLTGHPVMVFNDTRVLPTKLEGTLGECGKSIEVLLVKEDKPGTWQVLLKDLKRYKPGQQMIFGKGRLQAEFVGRHEDYALIRFDPGRDLESELEVIGKMPLPPYIRRSADDDADTERQDRERYQTVFANNTGAIAAPTAGLHFTTDMLARLSDSVDTVYLTLHVGPGTFQPVRVNDIREHQMQKEFFKIPAGTWQALARAKNEKRKIVAVGTTSTRVLESVDLNREEPGDVSGWTDRFIFPGQAFNNVDHLLTNFHLPKSTLYMLVCALAGPSLMRKAYREAIQEKYRFFSYGDAMLIL